MIKWHIETRKLSDLKDHPKNPRQLSHTQAQHLQDCLETFGIIDKIIINTDNTIIGGHARRKILKKMNTKEVECYVPERTLTEKEVDELNIRLNKNTGDFDYDILANAWQIEDLLSWGFEEKDFDIAKLVEDEAEEDEGNLPEPKKDEDADSKLLDLYELNEHRIVCGDSTLPETVEKCLNGAVPILMVTDPPYGVEYDPSFRDNAMERHGKNKAKGKVQNDERVDWSLAWFQFPGAVAYIWHAGKFCSEVERSLIVCDFEIVSQIIWAKQHFALSRGDYHWQHEPCWYAVKKGCEHNWQGSRKESTLWEIANLNCFGKSKEDGEERTAHSTQKPIECMARPIRNNTAVGEGVYDPFLGSGTTLIAAEQLGRICYGIELSPAYIDIIVDRWVKYMQKNNKQFIIKKNGEIIQWQDQADQKHQ